MIQIKPGQADPKELLDLSPLLLIVLGHFSLFCAERDLPCEITRLVQPAAGEKTLTHKQGRAADASTKEWTDKDIDDCLEYLQENCGHLGAFSAGTGEQNVAIHHRAELPDGTLGAPHFHFQVMPFWYFLQNNGRESKQEED